MRNSHTMRRIVGGFLFILVLAVADGMEVGYPDTAPFIEEAETVYHNFYEENDWAEDLVERIRAAEEPGTATEQTVAQEASRPRRGKR